MARDRQQFREVWPNSGHNGDLVWNQTTDDNRPVMQKLVMPWTNLAERGVSRGNVSNMKLTSAKTWGNRFHNVIRNQRGSLGRCLAHTLFEVA